ncbi:MAG: hypothetical protein Q7O66_17745 [Dehalococcoidia bacterium]|nr:hypothetical protein [Dehalococcoidia bacterium]
MFEKKGIPTVTFVTNQFQSLADTVRKGGGLPNLNLVVVPHPFDSLPQAEAKAIAEEFLAKGVEAITAGDAERVAVRVVAREEER